MLNLVCNKLILFSGCVPICTPFIPSPIVPPFIGFPVFQVIIQGLRESGVFRSVIESAPTTLSRDKFLASIESSNSTRSSASQSLPSRKMGRSEVSHATARRVLEITASVLQEVAVPPLSPPGIDDGLIS